MHLIEVAFKGNRKEFFRWDGEEPPRPRAAVIVEADRGEDLGRVHAVGELAGTRCAGCAHGCGTESPEKRALRLATPEDERRAAELRAQDEDARRRAMERVKAHGLVMKLSDAEWQWDRKKLTFYFTAEKRVDFRALVRDLAAAFRTRIELKQIGVRDEAKRLDGVGRCGRQYCSAGWLPELRPVNLQVAKDQRLSLNPSQISGACGRLMCCLRYEHDFYLQARKRFPKEGRVLRTRLGEEKVVANDIFNERVTLRGAEGDTRVVPLAVLRDELEASALPAEAEDRAPADAGPEAPDAEGAGAEAAEAEDRDAEGAPEDVARSWARGEGGSRRPTESRAGAVKESASTATDPRPTEPRHRRAAPRRGQPAAPVASNATPSTPGAAPYPGSRRRGRRGGRRGRGGDGQRAEGARQGGLPSDGAGPDGPRSELPLGESPRTPTEG